MSKVYTWVISAMNEYPKSQELSNVVFQIHYRRNATEVDGDKTYFADTYSVLSVAAPSEDAFVPYEDLTEEMVISWLEAGLDVEAIDSSLDAKIEEQKNPKVVTLPLPWITNNVVILP